MITDLFLASMVILPTLVERIEEAQLLDMELGKLIKEVQSRSKQEFNISEDGILKYRNFVCA